MNFSFNHTWAGEDEQYLTNTRLDGIPVFSTHRSKQDYNSMVAALSRVIDPNKTTSNTSEKKYKGVKRLDGTYAAQICIKGSYVRLGTFGTAKEAAKEYDKAAIQRLGHMKEKLNFPELYETYMESVNLTTQEGFINEFTHLYSHKKQQQQGFIMNLLPYIDN